MASSVMVLYSKPSKKTNSTGKGGEGEQSRFNRKRLLVRGGNSSTSLGNSNGEGRPSSAGKVNKNSSRKATIEGRSRSLSPFRSSRRNRSVSPAPMAPLQATTTKRSTGKKSQRSRSASPAPHTLTSSRTGNSSRSLLRGDSNHGAGTPSIMSKALTKGSSNRSLMNNSKPSLSSARTGNNSNRSLMNNLSTPTISSSRKGNSDRNLTGRPTLATASAGHGTSDRSLNATPTLASAGRGSSNRSLNPRPMLSSARTGTSNRSLTTGTAVNSSSGRPSLETADMGGSSRSLSSQGTVNSLAAAKTRNLNHGSSSSLNRTTASNRLAIDGIGVSTLTGEIAVSGVRFPAQEIQLCAYCEYGQLPELTDEICSAMWYELKEYTAFRRKADFDSKAAVRKGLDGFIENTYGYAPVSVTTAEKSKKSKVSGENDDSPEADTEAALREAMSASAQKALTYWSKCKDTRRGLERFISKDYSQRRLMARKRALQAVLYTQQQLRQEKNKSPDRSAKAIAQVISGISTDSVNFAIMLGHADYEAIKVKRKSSIFSFSVGGEKRKMLRPSSFAVRSRSPSPLSKVSRPRRRSPSPSMMMKHQQQQQQQKGSSSTSRATTPTSTRSVRGPPPTVAAGGTMRLPRVAPKSKQRHEQKLREHHLLEIQLQQQKKAREQPMTAKAVIQQLSKPSCRRLRPDKAPTLKVIEVD